MREIKTKIETVIITYESIDGISFNDINECAEHENEIEDKLRKERTEKELNFKINSLEYKINDKPCEIPTINLGFLDANNDFKWYYIQNIYHLRLFNEKFNLEIKEYIKLPEYICIETIGEFDLCAMTYSECKKDIMKFLAHFNLDALNKL